MLRQIPRSTILLKNFTRAVTIAQREASYLNFSKVPDKTAFGKGDPNHAQAVVAKKPENPTDLNWVYRDDIKVRQNLHEEEILVQMTSVGICHTDVAMSVVDQHYPKIMGHEGVGRVVKVGSKVSKFKAGDPVILTYHACGECRPCMRQKPSFCSTMYENNLLNNDPHQNFTDPELGPVSGNFFRQSSFAQFSITTEANTVNLSLWEKELGETDFNKFGPLGCGIMTGSGAMLNSAGVKAGDNAAVYGCGGVGVSAIMGAKIAGANIIIAVDIDPGKLEIAKKVGATHTILADPKNPDYVNEQIREITNGGGVDASVETTGGAARVEQALKNTANVGAVAFLGLPKKLDDVVKLDYMPLLMQGKRLVGSVEGDTNPHEFIPKLIEFYKNGQLPLDAIEKFYHVKDFQEALDDMKSGVTTKAILVY